MKVLLTGGTGFLGKAIRKCLNVKKQSVTLLTQKNTKLLNNEKEISKIDLLKLNFDDFRNIIKPFDAIIHAAWYVNPDDYIFSSKNINHLNASLNLSRAIASYDKKFLIGLGTCLEYDLTPGVLYPDNIEKPQNMYSLCKLSYKNITKELFKNTNHKFIWARLFYIYGDGEHPKRLYPSVKQAIREGKPLMLSSGEHIRDFLEVNIASEMIVKCLSMNEKFKIVNISSGKGQTIRDFVLSVSGEFNHLMKFGKRNEGIIKDPVIIGGQ